MNVPDGQDSAEGGAAMRSPEAAVENVGTGAAVGISAVFARESQEHSALSLDGIGVFAQAPQKEPVAPSPLHAEKEGGQKGRVEDEGGQREGEEKQNEAAAEATPAVPSVLGERELFEGALPNGESGEKSQPVASPAEAESETTSSPAGAASFSLPEKRVESGVWKCSGCLVQNEASCEVCPCCETRKDGTRVRLNDSSLGIPQRLSLPPKRTVR